MKDRLLILDIDETLIHTELIEAEFDFIMTFNDDTYTYFVKKRPHLDKFLKWAFENWQVGIFTTSTYDYVEKIMKNLGYSVSDFKFVFDREYCNTKSHKFDHPHTGGRYYVKRLEKVKRTHNIALEKMIIVDDKPETASENYGNLVQIKPFYSDINDTELLKLMDYLETIKDAANFRSIEKRGWSND